MEIYQHIKGRNKIDIKNSNYIILREGKIVYEKENFRDGNYCNSIISIS